MEDLPADLLAMTEEVESQLERDLRKELGQTSSQDDNIDDVVPEEKSSGVSNDEFSRLMSEYMINSPPDPKRAKSAGDASQKKMNTNEEGEYDMESSSSEGEDDSEDDSDDSSSDDDPEIRKLTHSDIERIREEYIEEEIRKQQERENEMSNEEDIRSEPVTENREEVGEQDDDDEQFGEFDDDDEAMKELLSKPKEGIVQFFQSKISRIKAENETSNETMRNYYTEMLERRNNDKMKVQEQLEVEQDKNNEIMEEIAEMNDVIKELKKGKEKYKKRCEKIKSRYEKLKSSRNEEEELIQELNQTLSFNEVQKIDKTEKKGQMKVFQEEDEEEEIEGNKSSSTPENRKNKIKEEKEVEKRGIKDDVKNEGGQNKESDNRIYVIMFWTLLVVFLVTQIFK